MAKIDRRAIVAKEHKLVDKMNQYTLQELRLIAFCLAHYDPYKSDNPKLQATISDMVSIFSSMDERSAYSVIKATIKALGSKPIEFMENGELFYWNWFAGFKYKSGEAIFSFYINPYLKPYLLELRSTFTRYRLEDVYQFTSATTWKLYEQLKKCWEKKPTWTVTLDELKIKLGIPGKYPRWNNFKARVVDPAIKQINDNSDIRVKKYAKEKHGRRIIGLVFFVEKKAPEGTIGIESDLDRSHALTQALLHANISKKQAQAFVKDAEKFGKVDTTIQLVNALIEDYEKLEKKPCALPKYVMSNVSDALHQQRLFSEKTAGTPAKNIMDHVPEQWRTHHDVLRDIAAYTESHGEAYVLKNVAYAESKKPADFAAYLGNTLKQNYGAGYNPGPVEKPGPVIEPGMMIVWKGQEYTIDGDLCIYPESGNCLSSGPIIQGILDGEIEIKMDE